MSQNIEAYIESSKKLCDKLVYELKANEEEASIFFGGEILKAYIKANDHASEKATSIKNKLQNI